MNEMNRKGTTLALLCLSLCIISARAQEAPRLEAILRVRAGNAGERLVTRAAFEMEKLKTGAETGFVAVTASEWPVGLVPLFAVQAERSFELRRLPARGQESHSEPLFFALPPENEMDATKIAGQWHGVAENSQRSNHSPDWQLAIDGERVAGRFDPHGEYRVAFIAGGSFRSNRLELNVEYINDRYVLNGEWRDGKLMGEWRQLEEPENGTWEATRPPGPTGLPGAKGAVPLFEWRRGTERRYSVDGKLNEPEWRRVPRPLCRVWQ